jgi:F-type H+/Na+-transporting ATPase subunit beta
MTANGRILQIIGPVVDVVFENEQSLPRIYEALEIKKEDGTSLILECQQHIGEKTVQLANMSIPIVENCLTMQITLQVISFL